jgi:hypothetical protein
MKEIIEALRKPFSADRIEWRLQSSGEKQDGSIWAKCLCYIDNRAAMERLDEVYGMAWSHSEEFKQIGNQAVCTVTITIESRHGEGVNLFPYRTVSGSCAVEANGDIDPFKSAASGAMKRAVVNLGVGRYLYDLPEAWAIIDPKGKYDGKTKNGTRFRWNPPQLPAWAGGGADTNYAVNQSAAVEDFIDTLPTVPAMKPKAAPLPAGTADDPTIPFGDAKGQPLSSLPLKGPKDKKCADLYYWAKVYTPKPYNGKISQKDINLKSRAEALYANATGASEAPSPVVQDEPIDEVPF